jgi:hypothetical protein
MPESRAPGMPQIIPHLRCEDVYMAIECMAEVSGFTLATPLVEATTG